MTKNDKASQAHNDGGAAKTRLDGESEFVTVPREPTEAMIAAGRHEVGLVADAGSFEVMAAGAYRAMLSAAPAQKSPVASGESPAGDVDALVERLTRLQQSGHCGESASEAIARGRYNETLTQAAEALTSLRTERDEAKSDLRVFLKSGITGADVNWCARAEAAEARALKAEAGWDWIAAHRNLELDWDEIDEGEAAWRIHRVSGGRNDREWELIATGETPLEAVTKARDANLPLSESQ